MRFQIILCTILLTVLPFVAEAVSAPRTFHELTNQIVTALSSVTVTLVLLGVVIYLYGVATNMMKLSEGDPSAFKAYVMWGIIVLFVMVSIWGILGILRETVFSADAGGSVQGGNNNSHFCTSLSDPNCSP